MVLNDWLDGIMRGKVDEQNNDAINRLHMMDGTRAYPVISIHDLAAKE